MTRGTFLKFIYVASSNRKRLIGVNLLLIIPLVVFVYTLIQLIPYLIGYINSFTLSIQEVNPKYGKLAVVLVSEGGDENGLNDRVYVFRKEDFSGVRREILRAGGIENVSIIESTALGFSTVPLFRETMTVHDGAGQPLVTLRVQSMEEGTVEILFVRGTGRKGGNILLYTILFGSSFILMAGSLGGVSDYTQRIVFHETKNFSYFLRAIERYFIRSLAVSSFFLLVIGAIAINIYFYIFVISSDFSVFVAALNVWMFILFLFIFFWVFPLLILNGDEPVWRVMKKSLFVSFDNFNFTLDALLFLLLMGVSSCLTVSVVPGFAGMSFFMNSALKDITYRYRSDDSD